MASTKREREQARQRQLRWEAQAAKARARRRRVAAITAAVLVLALGGGGLAIGLAGHGGRPSGSTASLTLPSPTFAQDRTWTAKVTTNRGPITVELDGHAAPQAVASFVYLAQHGFFDSTPCHRLTTSSIFVLQCGSPDGSPSGGPGYTFGPIENAPADNVYKAGTLAMARVMGDGASMGSQFFLVYQDSTIPPDSAGGYTVFGKITSGLDIVQAVAAQGVSGGGQDGPPATPVTIQGVDTK